MLINQVVNNDPLTQLFTALADPTRRSIIERLTRGSATVNELAEPYDMSLPAVSKHIKVLEEAGIVSKTVNGQQRECHLEALRLQEAEQWLEQYKQFWQANLDNLDVYLNRIRSQEKD